MISYVLNADSTGRPMHSSHKTEVGASLGLVR